MLSKQGASDAKMTESGLKYRLSDDGQTLTRCSDSRYSNLLARQTYCERYPKPIKKSPNDSCGEFDPAIRTSTVIFEDRLPPHDEHPIKTKWINAQRRDRFKAKIWYARRGPVATTSGAVVAAITGLATSIIVIYDFFFSPNPPKRLVSRRAEGVRKCSCASGIMVLETQNRPETRSTQ